MVDILKLHPEGGGEIGCVALEASVGLAGSAWGRVGIKGSLEHLLLASPGGSGGAKPRAWGAGTPAEHTVECGLGEGGRQGWEAKATWEAAACAYLAGSAKVVVAEGGAKTSARKCVVALRALAAAAREGLSSLIDSSANQASVASGEEEDEDDSDEEIIEVTPGRCGASGAEEAVTWRDVLWTTCGWVEGGGWLGSSGRCGLIEGVRGAGEWYAMGKGDAGGGEQVGDVEVAVAIWWDALLSGPRTGKDAISLLWQREKAARAVLRHLLWWISCPSPLRPAGLRLFASLDRFAPSSPNQAFASHEQGSGAEGGGEGAEGEEEEDSDDEIIEVDPASHEAASKSGWREDGGACIVGLLVALGRAWADGEYEDEEEMSAVGSHPITSIALATPAPMMAGLLLMPNLFAGCPCLTGCARRRSTVRPPEPRDCIRADQPRARGWKHRRGSCVCPHLGLLPPCFEDAFFLDPQLDTGCP